MRGGYAVSAANCAVSLIKYATPAWQNCLATIHKEAEGRCAVPVWR